MDSVTNGDTPTATVHPNAEMVGRVRDDMNRLRGRLFQALEAVGLPDTQCRAAKGLIRRITYDMQAALERDLRGGHDARNASDYT